MSVEKVPVEPEVKHILTSIIKDTKRNWQGLKSYTNTKEEFLNTPVPNENKFYYTGEHIFLSLPIDIIKPRLLKVQKIIGADSLTNWSVYPPNSIMGWHTNSDDPGIRSYYTFSLNESIFRYVDKNGNIIDDYDNKGWTVRRFEVGSENLLWHTIWSEGIRFAFGFNKKTDLS